MTIALVLSVRAKGGGIFRTALFLPVMIAGTGGASVAVALLWVWLFQPRFGLLKLIAGVEVADAGEIWIGNRRVDTLPPGARDVAMVFQSYALYPHLTVRDNIAFALKLQKVPKEEIDKRVAFAARTLELTENLDRRPAQL